jgi:inhibitor of KinA
MRIALTWTSERSVRLSPDGSGSLPSSGTRTDHAATVFAAITRFAESLGRTAPPWLIEIVPTAHAIHVVFDPLLASEADVAAHLDACACRVFDDLDSSAVHRTERVVEVPVCYQRGFAPDIDEVSSYAGLSTADVIDRHIAARYRVECIGFAPGFAYLGGLETALHIPRRADPRTRVPAGSVAIAGRFTAVYPQTSPGGWRIIGRTPMRMFDQHADPPAVLRVGDVVRFRPLSPSEFDTLDRLPNQSRPR